MGKRNIKRTPVAISDIPVENYEETSNAHTRLDNLLNAAIKAMTGTAEDEKALILISKEPGNPKIRADMRFKVRSNK